jgi:hypothetical protein
MLKDDRMTEFAGRLAQETGRVPELAGLHVCYAGFFVCFNEERYYEAHDILEHLWLQSAGEDWRFYKGLIQLAGGFVHFRLQYFAPEHRVHGGRLRPGARLLRLAIANIAGSAPTRHRLRTADVIQIADAHASLVEQSGFTTNPWRPGAGPRLLPAAAQEPM